MSASSSFRSICSLASPPAKKPLLSRTHRDLFGMIFAFGLLLLSTVFAAHSIQAQERPVQKLKSGEIYPIIQDEYALYSRTKDAATATRDTDHLYKGKPSLRIVHTGQTDWAIRSVKAIQACPGDIIEISAFILNKGPNSAGPSATLYKQDGRSAVRWAYGQRLVGPTSDWTRLVSRFVVPSETVYVMPRIVGAGKTELYLADCSVTIKGRAASSAATSNPTLENAFIKVDYSSQTGCFNVLDKRTGRRWTQYPGKGTSLITKIETGKNEMIATFLDNQTAFECRG
ncbi:MAG: hypothetical protein PHQ75_07400, partial [Thermoguttaceae bacterium]|nr:hypothetical protein [Thermoguttaceae bacterium]